MKEKQIVFPFIVQDNILNGKVCPTCKHQQDCLDLGETLTHDHSCGEWELAEE